MATTQPSRQRRPNDADIRCSFEAFDSELPTAGPLEARPRPDYRARPLSHDGTHERKVEVKRGKPESPGAVAQKVEVAAAFRPQNRLRIEPRVAPGRRRSRRRTLLTSEGKILL